MRPAGDSLAVCEKQLPEDEGQLFLFGVLCLQVYIHRRNDLHCKFPLKKLGNVNDSIQAC
ncbi:hypothetical protein B1A75_02585 [Geobacillus sp. LEMMY01]|nr:hypothetical protein B1A75_02585 [Geobacillus sp. LEMMY01]